MSVTRKVSALLLAVSLVLAATPAVPEDQTSANSWNVRTLRAAFEAITALHSCYTGSLRAVKRPELEEWSSMVVAIIKDAEARGADSNLVWIDTRRQAWSWWWGKADPAPWICHRARLYLSEVWWARFPEKCIRDDKCKFPENYFNEPSDAMMRKLNWQGRLAVRLPWPDPTPAELERWTNGCNTIYDCEVGQLPW